MRNERLNFDHIRPGSSNTLWQNTRLLDKRGTEHFRWQVFGLNDLRRRHYGQPVAYIFQLAHIARERKSTELLQGCFSNAFGLYAELLGTLLQEMPG